MVDIRISPTAFNYADAWIKGVTAGQNQSKLDLDWDKWLNTMEQQAKVEEATAKATAARDAAVAGASSAAAKAAGAAPFTSGAVKGDGKPTNGTAVWSGLSTDQRALLDSIAQNESAGSYTKVYGGRDFTSFGDHPRIAVPIAGRPGKTSSAAGRYQFLGSTWDAAAGALGLKDFSPENQDKAALWLAQRDYARNSGGRSLDADLQSRAFNPRYLASTWTSLPGGVEGSKATGIAADRWNKLYAANLQRAQGGAAGGPEQGPPAPTQPAKVRVQSVPQQAQLTAPAPVLGQSGDAAQPQQFAPVAPLDTRPGANLGLPSIGNPLAPNFSQFDQSNQQLLDQTPFGTYADPATLDMYRNRRSDFAPGFISQQQVADNEQQFDPNMFFPGVA